MDAGDAAERYTPTVRYILDNPKYRGQVEYFFRWQGEKARIVANGKHEAIVDAPHSC